MQARQDQEYIEGERVQNVMSVKKEKVNMDKENVKKNVNIEERVQHFNKQF